MRNLWIVLTCALLFSASTPISRAAEVQAGTYLIRYNALSANFLPKAATDRYGLEHSTRQGLVNVSVLQGKGSGASTVAAEVSGYASTLTGAKVPIRFQRVKDSGGESWLGSFRIPGTDTLRFELDVTPADAASTHVTFSHDYIVE